MVAVPQRFASVPIAFRNESFVLDARGVPVAVAVTSSIVSSTITDELGRVYRTQEVVELSRLCAKPGERWATRVALRLWRETAAPFYLPWKPVAAFAYSKNDRHDGRTYRFDGWTRVRSTAGSSGGGGWSRKRYAADAAHGPKTLWVWRYV